MLSGVRVVAGAVGNLPSVLDSQQLGVALGGLEDVVSSDSGDDGDQPSSSPDDDTTVSCETLGLYGVSCDQLMPFFTKWFVLLPLLCPHRERAA